MAKCAGWGKLDKMLLLKLEKITVESTYTYQDNFTLVEADFSALAICLGSWSFEL